MIKVEAISDGLLEFISLVETFVADVANMGVFRRIGATEGRKRTAARM
jgi:hypothetical protein